MNRTVVEFLCYNLFVLTSFFCAGQVAPSGGPPDKTPPEIVSTYPTPGTTNFHDKKIRIEFSKYVDLLKVQQSIFVSPNLGTLTYDWGGKDVEIQFADSVLRPNTTYILTLGTDVEDTRGNRLAQAFALPFSTGERIDSASIAGKVFDEKPVGVMIFAFMLNNRRPDTLNPIHTKPDYLTQTGKDGAFTLPNLAPGSYRLFAIRDEYKNLLYDQQTDQFGIAAASVHLTTPTATVTGLQFRLTSEDTTRPFLSSARALDRSHVLLRFSEAMDTASINLLSVEIAETTAPAALHVLDVSFMETLLEAQVVTTAQESAKVYKVSIAGARDLHENPLNDNAGSPIFEASIVHDTTTPRVTFLSGQDSIRNIDPRDSIDISFSEPIQRTLFERGFDLVDSAKREVPGRMAWSGSARVVFLPIHLLTYGAWYRATMRLDSIVDYAGNRAKDTLLVRRFQTIREDVFGSIAGTITDEAQNVQGKVYLFATDIAGKNARVHQIVLDAPGSFIVEYLPEGKYTLWVFRDVDGNGTYTYGAVFPYHPAERFTIYPDTLKVRARWPLEGVNLQLKHY
ncbi:MAG: Ig-like domain-containing protein [Ignavibacteriae bacterium]|nr:Ig-like domain-containing protein [Ignavibacteria bacterium]MBI3363980.1 Ig-like domain-containing protein [Ignavibacteriota bacterium]